MSINLLPIQYEFGLSSATLPEHLHLLVDLCVVQ